MLTAPALGRGTRPEQRVRRAGTPTRAWPRTATRPPTPGRRGTPATTAWLSWFLICSTYEKVWQLGRFMWCGGKCCCICMGMMWHRSRCCIKVAEPVPGVHAGGQRTGDGYTAAMAGTLAAKVPRCVAAKVYSCRAWPRARAAYPGSSARNTCGQAPAPSAEYSMYVLKMLLVT